MIKIDKVAILASETSHRTDIAMLVDKQDFLEELQSLRQKWQITKLESTKGLFPGTTSSLHFEGIFKSKFDAENAKQKYEEFSRDIDLVLQKFKRGKNFRQVVLYALFAGTIPDGVFQNCYFDVVTINEPADLSKPENYQYVIVMSPRTQQKEVIQAYKEFQQHIQGKINFHKPRIPLDSPVTKEFTEAVECIEKEKKIAESKTKEDSSFEGISKAMAAFFKNTEKAREYLLQIGDLNIDIPEHRELIEQFHAGNIYNTADMDKFRKKTDIDRIREWYWMRYGENFNDISKEPVTYKEVYFSWMDKCPQQNEHTDKKSAKACQYCNIQSWNNIEVALKDYRKLLSQS